MVLGRGFHCDYLGIHILIAAINEKCVYKRTYLGMICFWNMTIAAICFFVMLHFHIMDVINDPIWTWQQDDAKGLLSRLQFHFSSNYS
ncbi:hypothetical protein Bpfe_006888 [Biomphalaria pfeifferi]|uniref:Uncharacterized protein n=1 Tax=Biomphalaria pfeifferi TaxID=112525 RepID=A0AAD8FG40_BIOPF|nr:hypothetical protein Bpfe_006888 [Biomphalaria pfeifferi]